MSLARYAKRRDSAERPIIEALEAAGFDVYPGDDVDLKVRRPDWAGGLVRMLEVKSSRGRRKDGSVIHDKRQGKQRNFLESTGTPIVSTPAEALEEMGALRAAGIVTS